MTDVLPARGAAELLTVRSHALPEPASSTAAEIVDRVRREGEPALRRYAAVLDGLQPGRPLWLDRADLQAALTEMARDDRSRLERIADRIRRFAAAQREVVHPLTTLVSGGEIGTTIEPVESAGCYAPGGRYPLPSSVLMTAITARAAGVRSVWVASPRPAPITVAAAAVAGADGLLAAGGAQAIAALAYGIGRCPPCDVVVGPGNQYVTAAKQYVAGDVTIDMPAGPSELVVLADTSADPAWIAADLLAQAEHDDEAVPVLVAVSPLRPTAIREELERQLADLPTAATARRALQNGGVVCVESVESGIDFCNRFAPEHLQLCVRDAETQAGRIRHCGGLFIGSGSAEVIGDYGAGPNHVLPTGGAARRLAGLSVVTFLRMRTWMRIDDLAAADDLLDDVTWFARQEGLEAHARAADLRRGLPE